MTNTETARVDCLDGLRGLAALWVFLGHGLILTGWRVPVAGDPDLGVDLFMMLSGFLMVFHYRLREQREPWSATGTWLKFWIRRYFRIAPLYYVVLVVALICGPYIFGARVRIDTFLLRPWQDPGRYLDTSLGNILTHLTFVFGVMPRFAYSTPLPDWSLGLEMQFYAVFPMAMLLVRRFGWIAGVLVIAGVSVGLALGTQQYLKFPMPSFLPLKMHVFLCGMLLAAATQSNGKLALVYFAFALALAVVPIGGGSGTARLFARAVLVCVFFALVLHRMLPGGLGRVAGRIATLLGTSGFHWLGELSFGTYLVHLLILQPAAAAIVGHVGGTITAPGRFLILVVLSVPPVYFLSWLLHFTLEISGQRVGRHLIQYFSARPTLAEQRDSEIVAAPHESCAGVGVGR